MTVMLGLGLVAACGGSARRVTDPQAPLVQASGDPAAVEKLLMLSVTNGGLWFEDAQCAAQFGSPGEIGAERFGAFAKCLAGLKLQKSKRKDALPDVAVLTYGPGLEVQARIVSEARGPRLAWIGFSSRRAGQEDAPTITPEALEALRTGGGRSIVVDAETEAALHADAPEDSRPHSAWLRVCIDESGAVSGVTPHVTSAPSASRAFSDAIRTTWTFKPFTLGGQPVPACAMVRMSYPAEIGEVEETLPLPTPVRANGREPLVFTEGANKKFVEARRVSGQIAVVPDDETKVELTNQGIEQVTGSFRVCTDEQGRVESVLPYRPTGFASYDRTLVAALEKWVYAPFSVDGQPVPTCSIVTFVYRQR